MYKDFQYRSVPLDRIVLDPANPRIVTEKPLKTQAELIEYLVEHEDLISRIQKIAREGKNPGAERPYVVKDGDHYTVVEGNSRVAAYKILAGQIEPPEDLEGRVPKMADDERENLLTVDVAIAPNRERMMPILAALHFGRGDRSFWTFLSSRKAIADEYKRIGKVERVARTFNCKTSEILDYLLEWQLYQEALALPWTAAEKAALQKPRLEFNPPIRFFQTKGHADLVGVTLDKHNAKVIFRDIEAKNKFKHLILKLVVDRTPGLTATSKYGEVFRDYVPAAGGGASPGQPASTTGSSGGSSTGSAGGTGSAGSQDGQTGGAGTDGSGSSTLKPGRLFDLKPTASDALLDQLFKEARTLDCKKHPAAGTALFRTILEAITRRIVDDNELDKSKKVNSLETAITCITGASKPLSGTDKKLLTDFRKHHLDHINLSVHANKRPEYSRLEAAVGSLIEFLRKYA